MSADNFSQFISKKAYEISYALFRVAFGVKQESFASHLQDRGLSLLESAVGEDYETMLSASKSLEYLLRIGSDINILNNANSDLILNELRQLNSAIAESEKSASPLPVDLSDIFSKPPALTHGHEEHARQYEQAIKDTNGVLAVGSDEPLLEASFRNGFNGSNGNGFVKAAMRQSAILERIRQSGNCRLKDLQDYLKETSERTIRYDIQGLLGKGLIERLGNGGPSTYYRAKEPQAYES